MRPRFPSSNRAPQLRAIRRTAAAQVDIFCQPVLFFVRMHFQFVQNML